MESKLIAAVKTMLSRLKATNKKLEKLERKTASAIAVALSCCAYCLLTQITISGIEKDEREMSKVMVKLPISSGTGIFNLAKPGTIQSVKEICFFCELIAVAPSIILAYTIYYIYHISYNYFHIASVWVDNFLKLQLTLSAPIIVIGVTLNTAAIMCWYRVKKRSSIKVCKHMYLYRIYVFFDKVQN